MATTKGKEMSEFANQAAFDAFEAKQEAFLGLPRFQVNALTGLQRTDLPQVTKYTRPIPHPETGDNRIACYIDNNADRTGEIILSENKAKTKGWFVPEALPMGVMEASGAVPAQNNIGATPVRVNQFDISTKARGININNPADRIVISTAGLYEVEYSVEFAGDTGVTYTLGLYFNSQLQTFSQESATYDGTPILLAGSWSLDLSPGAVIELRVSCSSSASFKVNSGSLIANELEDPTL